MSTGYPVPAQTIRIETHVANSKFIATAGRADSAAAARAFVENIRNEFADATHTVYAFRAGYGGSVVEGSSDGGEPPGSAGRPVLAVLRGLDIGDVVVTITRYFGGTKLGIGGLVRAYTQAAQKVLGSLPLARRMETRRGVIVAPYSLYQKIQILVASCDGEIEEGTFGTEVTLNVKLPADQADGFDGRLARLSGARLHVDWK